MSLRLQNEDCIRDILDELGIDIFDVTTSTLNKIDTIITDNNSKYQYDDDLNRHNGVL